MTHKADFTPEQWDVLVSGPVAAGVSVVMSHPNVLGMPREFLALGRAIKDVAAAGPARELAIAIADDIDEVDQDDDLPAEEAKAAMMARLHQAVGLAESKLSEDVALGYKQWVLHVARATAEASKEGGFLGIGGVRVTDKERAALDAIEATLGL